MLHAIDSQVRALRARQTIDGYRAGLRRGAYWGIRTDIAEYPGVGARLPLRTDARARPLPTRLGKLDPTTQQRLINWGYAVSDAALRAHVDPAAAPPPGFPYRSAGIG